MIARVLAMLVVLLPAMAATQVLQLPNGLTLAQPLGTAMLQVADGWSITDPALLGRRVVDSLTVRLLPGAGPDAGGSETRTVAGCAVRYRVESSSGGSGGAEYRLTAWFAARGGHVLVAAATQAEYPARPDFARTWQVVADAVARNP
jgi:hypothetical protein